MITMKILECKNQLEALLSDLKFYSNYVYELNDIITYRANQDQSTIVPDPKLVRKTFEMLYLKADEKFLNDPNVAILVLYFITTLRDYFNEEILKLEVPAKTDDEINEERRKEIQNVN